MKFLKMLADWLTSGGACHNASGPGQSENSHRFIQQGNSQADDGPTTNAATGLPMIGGIGSFDVGGSPYGMNLHDDDC